MGWNTLRVRSDPSAARRHPDRPDGLHAYFVHSYHLAADRCDRRRRRLRRAVTAMVGRDNLVGTQFHPRRASARSALIANFLRWRRDCPKRGADRPHCAPHPPSPCGGEVGARATPNAVILFPAIDLKDGQCVRLVQGDMAQATVFNDDPAAQARASRTQGFDWLHVVDLDGAFAGQAVNAGAVERILEAVGDPGAARRRHPRHGAIEGWLGAGVDRVILGTAAVRDPALVSEAAGASRAASRSASMRATARSPSRAGPRRPSSRAVDLARASRTPASRRIVYTDIDRDGMLDRPQRRGDRRRSPRA